MKDERVGEVVVLVVGFADPRDVLDGAEGREERYGEGRVREGRKTTEEREREIGDT